MRIGGNRAKAGAIKGCLCCSGAELFLRKDFPQRMGLLIVIAGFLASTVAWYHYQLAWAFGILFGTALIDVILYVLMDEVLVCYRCHAEYRNVADRNSFLPFQLDVHERHRQERARTARI